MDLNIGPSADGAVLYVEDESSNVLLMEMLFDRLDGPRLVVATSCEEALRLAPGIKPLLMLIDLRLSDGHGVQLLEQLRKSPSCRDVAAVAVTGESDFYPEGTGFSEVWRKPLNVAFVLARLAQLCERPKALRPAPSLQRPVGVPA